MASSWFADQLKTALASLYDPTVLRTSPLVELLGASQRGDPVAGLRSALTESIESIRPSGNTPHETRAWRAYQILRRRYIEGLGQRQVAANLGLGVRQLQREEKLAREMLAEHIWTVYGLQAKLPADAGVPEEDREPLSEAAEDPVEEELEWLRSSVPVQLTNVSELLEEILKTIEPLTRKFGVAVTYEISQALHAPLRAPILRQALVDIASTVLGYARGGLLSFEVKCLPESVRILLKAYDGSPSPVEAPAGRAESLAMAERLVQICDGTFQITTDIERASDPQLVFGACLTIQVAQQKSVLVIDDNVDSLQLMQRYLAGTPYLFIGAQDAQSGMELAVKHRPSAILLDIMMLSQDGWSVLGQLREQIQTSHIPVIVCTLLSQRDLALALGAAGFLRKPIKRAELLANLDRLSALAPSVP